jgi:hypothetical protein
MIVISGRVIPGFGDFRKRMTAFPTVFSQATGEKLIAGTVNVNVGVSIPVREHFRIRGADIQEPEQDLLFEICRVGPIWAYRIRPFNLTTGEGGHGDDVIEISSSQQIPNAHVGDSVTISLFRDNI